MIAVIAVLAGSGPEGPPRDRPVPDSGRIGEGPLRITLLGTSLADRATWPDRLARELTECSGQAVAVTRIAEPGANSRWGLTQVEEVARSEPDLVLIEFAINDADLRDGLWPAESREVHRGIVSAVRAEAPEAAIALMTTNPAHGLRGVMRPRLGAYYLGYRDLAEELDTGLFDAWPRWRGVRRDVIGDGLHPDPRAEEVILSGPILSFAAAALSLDC